MRQRAASGNVHATVNANLTRTPNYDAIC